MLTNLISYNRRGKEKFSSETFAESIACSALIRSMKANGWSHSDFPVGNALVRAEEI